MVITCQYRKRFVKPQNGDNVRYRDRIVFAVCVQWTALPISVLEVPSSVQSYILLKYFYSKTETTSPNGAALEL